jgi:hypothetical protein
MSGAEFSARELAHARAAERAGERAAEGLSESGKFWIFGGRQPACAWSDMGWYI